VQKPLNHPGRPGGEILSALGLSLSFQNSVGVRFAAEAIHALPKLRSLVCPLQALVFVDGKQIIDEVFLA